MATSHPGLKKRQLTLAPLVLTLFCLVCGGPFGLEETILLSGSGLGLLLILILPFIWALPVGLMTAELTAAIPEEGGSTLGPNGRSGDSGGSKRAGGPGSIR